MRGVTRAHQSEAPDRFCARYVRYQSMAMWHRCWRKNDATATVHLDGQDGNLRMGGSGVDGDVFLFRSNGNRSNDATATVHLDAQDANLRMGGSGVDGAVIGKAMRRLDEGTGLVPILVAMQ